jgi:hypothetical protein
MKLSELVNDFPSLEKQVEYWPRWDSDNGAAFFADDDPHIIS